MKRFVCVFLAVTLAAFVAESTSAATNTQAGMNLSEECIYPSVEISYEL